MERQTNGSVSRVSMHSSNSSSSENLSTNRNASSGSILQNNINNNNNNSNSNNGGDKYMNSNKVHEDNLLYDESIERYIDDLVDNVPSQVPRLDTLCVRALARDFPSRASFKGVKQRFVPRICALLDVDLPVGIAAVAIDDEPYWKRRCVDRWPNCDIAVYEKKTDASSSNSKIENGNLNNANNNTGNINSNSNNSSNSGNNNDNSNNNSHNDNNNNVSNSNDDDRKDGDDAAAGGSGDASVDSALLSPWKRLFLERNLIDALESYDGGEAALEDLARLMEISASHVRRLTLKQLLSHFDMEELFFGVPDLEELDLTYGVKEMGLEYKKDLYGISRADARCLSNAVSRSTTLTTLVLQNNRIDDTHCRVLCAGLVANRSVTRLDLSHNLIGDIGARAVAKVLSAQENPLESLHMCDNAVREEGAFAIGKALRKNHTLTELNLRLNRLGDAGGAKLFDNLVTNNTLVSLNVGSNQLEFEAASAIANFIRANTSLKSLDVSCSAIGEDGGAAMLAALKDNTTLLKVDLRMCGLDKEILRGIMESRLALNRAELVEKVTASGRFGY